MKRDRIRVGSVQRFLLPLLSWWLELLPVCVKPSVWRELSHEQRTGPIVISSPKDEEWTYSTEGRQCCSGLCSYASQQASRWLFHRLLCSLLQTRMRLSRQVLLWSRITQADPSWPKLTQDDPRWPKMTQASRKISNRQTMIFIISEAWFLRNKIH